MIENLSHHEIEKSSERNFGIVFAVVFLIIGFYPLLFDKQIYYWALMISLIFLFFSFYFTNLLVIPNKLWNKLGLLLSLIVSPIVMGIIFFFYSYSNRFNNEVIR